MTEGNRFIEKCLTTDVIYNPWPHQIIRDTLSKNTFIKLRDQCVEKLNFETEELHHIFPDDYKKYGIDFYDETVDLCTHLLKNLKELCDVFPKHRTYPKLGVNAHISVTPPLPYKFEIHQEGLEKIWSSVTYITPDINVGTKYYTSRKESSYIGEAPWVPNSSFIFCGQEGYTWHSYESNQTTNRITLNLFIQKTRKNKCFIELDDL